MSRYTTVFIILILFCINNSVFSEKLNKSEPKSATTKSKKEKRKITPFVEAGPKKVISEKKKTQTPEKKPDDKAEEKKDEDLEKYKEVLKYGISGKRLWVILQIKKKKDSKYYPLLKEILINESNDEVYTKAIEATGQLKLKDFAPLFSEKINSENREIKIAVIKTLSQFNYKQSEAQIVQIFNEEKDKWILRACISALGNFKSKKALPKLYKMFKNPKVDSDTKIAILKAIGEMKDTSSLPFLKEVLENKSNSSLFRGFAALSIGKIGDKNALKILKKFINDKDKRVVMSVAKAFGEMKTTESFDIIFKSLRNDNPEIRYSSLQALEKSRNPKAFPIVRYMVFNDANYKVRQKAVSVLSKMGGAEVVKLWGSELKSNKAGLKLEIINNIDNLDKKEAMKLLSITFKSESNNKIRKLILKKMFEVDQQSAAEFITKKVMNKNDRDYLGLKLFSVGLIFKKMNKDGIEVLEKYLTHQNTHVRRYSYFYILILKEPKGYEKVFQALPKEKDRNVLVYVIHIFRDKNIKKSIPFLKDIMMKSPFPEVRKEAYEIIKHLEKS